MGEEIFAEIFVKKFIRQQCREKQICTEEWEFLELKVQYWTKAK